METIKFTDLKVVKFKKDHPNVMLFKTSYRDVDFKRVERPGLSKKKNDDLLGLLNKKAIPSFYAPFYNSL
uniref:SFRICE_004270 n=1 Tax=Spodoptera frugiperda TaxID=7108 RepID=A0A2H1VTF2_SPOFR